jgi:hypothetical protein
MESECIETWSAFKVFGALAPGHRIVITRYTDKDGAIFVYLNTLPFRAPQFEIFAIYDVRFVMGDQVPSRAAQLARGSRMVLSGLSSKKCLYEVVPRGVME